MEIISSSSLYLVWVDPKGEDFENMIQEVACCRVELVGTTSVNPTLNLINNNNNSVEFIS